MAPCLLPKISRVEVTSSSVLPLCSHLNNFGVFVNAAAIIGVPQKLVLDNATVEPR